jgi:hypothetical protein
MSSSTIDESGVVWKSEHDKGAQRALPTSPHYAALPRAALPRPVLA